LKETGYIESQTVAIEYRFADGALILITMRPLQLAGIGRPAAVDAVACTAAQAVAAALLASGIPSWRADQGRDCGASEIQRTAESAPRWADVIRRFSDAAATCARCGTAMKDVVTIPPGTGEPGLVAYECPNCRHVTSVQAASLRKFNGATVNPEALRARLTVIVLTCGAQPGKGDFGRASSLAGAVIEAGAARTKRIQHEDRS
jgi:hypothetical protein